MGQVFLSYRHAQPDEDLADQLCAFLTGKGFSVFQDKQIKLGMDWVAEIDRQLRASSALVVLLSEASISSDMVRQEVQTAYELRQEGKMIILPVRLDFTGHLPYDLASYLNRIQYALWKPGEPVDALGVRIHEALSGGASLPLTPAEDTDAVPPDEGAAPLPAADPRIVVEMETGTIRLDSPFYVRRREDDRMERCLAQKGSTVVVKGPRQSGKSSLLARAHALARRNGLRSVYLDFQTFDEPQLASLGEALRALAKRIARFLRTSVQPSEVWDSDLLGDKGSFAAFLETAVLDSAAPPAVLLLDEVDRLFDRPYRGDFFAAVRGWHNNRALEQAWEGLHLFLGHATDPALWIENLNESPFNVGERLRLEDFTLDQIADLNARHGSPLRSPAEIEDLVRLVGGQPYLVRQALYVLASEGWSLVRLRDEADRDKGPFGDHLRRHLWSLHQHSPLREAVARVARGEGCDDEALFQRLLAAGLITGETRGEARLRCELYQAYFSRHL